MKALVTGATGFIGANLTRELLSQGFQVRALARNDSTLRNLSGLEVELVFGDVRDAEAMKGAVEGCDVVFHLAALYTFWVPKPQVIHDINVRGTENVLRAALREGVKKVVYTSSESTLGIDKGTGFGDEALDARPSELTTHYKRSKFEGEKVAQRICQEDLPLVTVNPTAVVGPYDIKPTPTSMFIVSFLNRNLPAYIETGLNWVSVENVAKGHILALQKGEIGGRYILGGENHTFQEILSMLGKITGIKPPQLRIPYPVALIAGYSSEVLLGRVLRRTPWITSDAVKAGKELRFFNCAKATAELGLSPTPVEEALRKAVHWFKENGYVEQGR